MGDLRTFIGAFLLAAAGPPAAADTLALRFAACAGHLTATVEHRWLWGFDPSGAERDRDALIALAEAAAAPVERVAATAALVEARAAMAALLSQAAFAPDPARRAAAAARAEALAAACAALVLRPAGA
jgi:hypothetical protein